MSVSIHRTSWARVNCSRLACCAAVSFECLTENDAIREIRSRGWHADGSKTLCPACVELRRTAEA